MFVREVMTRTVVTIAPDAHVKEALVLLDRHGITSIPVVDARGRIVGVVGEADLLRDAVPHDPRARLSLLPDGSDEPPEPARYVDQVMTRHPLVVTADADVAEAVEIMTSTVVKSLPVVDPRERVVGVISRRDVVHRLARADESLGRSVTELLRELDTGWSATAEDGVVLVVGPSTWRERELARTAAATVAGVRSVEIAEPQPLAAPEGP